MEPQSAVYSYYGCTYAFGYIRNFTVYGHVQEYLAVFAYDNPSRSASTVTVLFVSFVGVRALKAFTQCVD